MIDEPPPLDVIGGGSERDPWRPSRRQWQVFGAAGLALALAAGGTAVAQHRREQDRLDRAAAAGVRLVAVFLPDDPDAEALVPLALRQDGPGTVQVLSVRVDLPGFAEVRVDQALTGDGVGLLRVPVRDTARCGAGLLRPTAPDLVVTARTSRGTRLVRRATGSTDLARVLDVARDRCGWQPPDRALSAQVLENDTRGRSSLVRVGLENRSVLPLKVVALDAGPGTTVTAVGSLPLAVPGSPDPSSPAQQVGLQFRVRVTDCAKATEATSERGDVQLHLTARVTGPYGTTSVDLGPLQAQEIDPSTYELLVAPDPLLSDCPSPPYGLVGG